jgi:NhaP-type Na+/H+ or K+/H+ antiporter
MHEVELLLLLMVAVAGLSVLARPLGAPYPILLVLGGLVLGFVPRGAPVELPPEVVLLVFLPPLLYSGAFFSSPRDLRADLRAISLSAVGLVLATMAAVAVAAHAVVDGLSWGSRSRSGRAWRPPTHWPPPRSAAGWARPPAGHVPGGRGPGQRRGFSLWEVLTYLLNAVLFILVGLQLQPTLSGLTGRSAAALVGQAALVAAVVIAVRIAWAFTVPYLVRALDRRPSQVARRLGPRERLVISWSGMRGAVSLAAALALPLGAGAPGRARR